MSLQDKTEAPTQTKRDDARKDGKVARSMDLNSAFPLLAALAVMKVAGPYMIGGFTELMKTQFSSLHTTQVTTENVWSLITSLILKTCLLSMPIVLGVGAVGMTTNIMQVGMKIALKPLAPDPSKISFMKGIVKLVSPQSLVELLKTIIKLAVVGQVVYVFLRNEYPSLIQLMGMPISGIASRIGELCWGVVIRAASAILVVSLVDYVYQRMTFEKTLKMSKQEVKEEFKRNEGDPQVKGQIRQRQRALTKRKRMLDEIPKADVIITNPTHIAVALKYDPDKTAAPIVIAKGQRLVAQRIKAIALANNVMIVENKPVARMLFKVVEIGHPIPEDLYQAVAEILAFVYRVSRRQAVRK